MLINSTAIEIIFKQSQYDPIIIKGYLCHDSMWFGSNIITNQTFFKAFVINNTGQSDYLGLPFQVALHIIMLAYFIVISSIFLFLRGL